MGKAPHLPPEILDLIIQHLIYPPAYTVWALENDSARIFIKDIFNFRLASKAFAKIGLPYLLTTIRLLRLPGSFNRAEQIANHPKARFYVKKLICYGNVICSKCLLLRDGNRREAGVDDHDQEVIRVQDLIRLFPNLRSIGLHDWYEGDRMTPGRTTLTGYACDEFVPSDLLFMLDDTRGMEHLAISRVDGIMLHSLTHLRFSWLRKLSILVSYGDNFWPVQLPMIWPGLEVFDFRCCLRECMPIHFALPKGLKCLGLSGVEISAGYLPRTLSEIYLADVRFEGMALSGWVDVFLNWPHDCELFVAGTLIVESADSPWYDHGRNTGERVLGTTVDLILKEIRSTPRRFTGDFREALLKQIFAAPASSIHRDPSFFPRDICITSELKDVYDSVKHPLAGKSYPEWAC